MFNKNSSVAISKFCKFRWSQRNYKKYEWQANQLWTQTASLAKMMIRWYIILLVSTVYCILCYYIGRLCEVRYTHYSPESSGECSSTQTIAQCPPLSDLLTLCTTYRVQFRISAIAIIVCSNCIASCHLPSRSSLHSSKLSPSLSLSYKFPPSH